MMDTHAIADLPALNRLQQRALLVGGIALLAGIAGGFIDRPAGEALVLGISPRFFQAWLVGFLLCCGVTLGSLGWLMLHHLSGGQWGLVTRRILEASTRTLPIVAIFFLPVLLGIPALFEWSHEAVVQGDEIVGAKSPFLNVGFFIGRAAVYFAFWLLCTVLLNRWSEGQDRGTVATTPADYVRFSRFSGPGLVFLSLSITFASVDWIMSLEPEWYSTIFGLLTLVAQGLSALALTIAVLTLLAKTQPLAATLTPKHFHDLGNLLLAFVMLWAYLAFSQLLIIWSGNLPEEIAWYLKRMQGIWGTLGLVIAFGHFGLPFLLLLSRNLKRHPKLLARVAVFVLVMRFVEMIWLVVPAFDRQGFPISWLDVVVPVGMVGLWLFVFARNLRARALLPLNDPYFREIFAHEAH